VFLCVKVGRQPNSNLDLGLLKAYFRISLINKDGSDLRSDQKCCVKGITPFSLFRDLEVNH